MWYAVRCRGGEEENMIASCKNHIGNQVLTDAFIFTYDRMKRYQGKWHVERGRMFPDYVFLESGNEKKLSEELDRYREIVQVMEDKDMLWRVYPEEEEFLRVLCGQGHHLGMSRGSIRNGMLHVDKGPLRGLESRIRRVDRHKRTAKLEAPVKYTAGGSILAGLEILEKS